MEFFFCPLLCYSCYLCVNINVNFSPQVTIPHLHYRAHPEKPHTHTHTKWDSQHGEVL
uniref:Uncharacterized protein n=1 Tax=Anguilla anguilla TaxID=7936 RepID=A0A0E9WTA6_ANGAN